MTRIARVFHRFAWPWPAGALVFVAAGVFCANALAHEYYTPSFKIIHPWSEPTLDGQHSGQVYMRFEEVSRDDNLIAAHSPLAERVELRIASDDRSTAKSENRVEIKAAATQHVKIDDKATTQVNAFADSKGGSIRVSAGQTTELSAAQNHLVLVGLRAPMQWGRSYPMTLIFEKSGAVNVTVSIGAH